jgi:hypothetical protein
MILYVGSDWGVILVILPNAKVRHGEKDADLD